MKKHLLITNDDGIDSGFLHRLVAALSPNFKISVAAPAFEQSWIGRAISRHKEIEVLNGAAHFAEGVAAWSIDGTPTDCVNIALGHLIKESVDAVVSGINIGYNTTESLILSSGTVAGAMEGAQWGLPAIAFSQCVPFGDFEAIREAKGQTEGNLAPSLQAAAEHAARLTSDLITAPPPAGQVINVNFPDMTTPESQVKETVPAKVRLGTLYEKCGSNKFHFRFSEGQKLENDSNTDRAVLERGFISRSRLDFSRIGCL
ncbi:MAG: 5'-nucleotidase SurE [Opitutia bacterium UBA7350]|nr:MAG: 5'-nucleotidase SurE [Opitutae bacterium UBA7350]